MRWENWLFHLDVVKINPVFRCLIIRWLLHEVGKVNNTLFLLYLWLHFSNPHSTLESFIFILNQIIQCFFVKKKAGITILSKRQKEEILLSWHLTDTFQVKNTIRRKSCELVNFSRGSILIFMKLLLHRQNFGIWVLVWGLIF